MSPLKPQSFCHQRVLSPRHPVYYAFCLKERLRSGWTNTAPRSIGVDSHCWTTSGDEEIFEVDKILDRRGNEEEGFEYLTVSRFFCVNLLTGVFSAGEGSLMTTIPGNRPRVSKAAITRYKSFTMDCSAVRLCCLLEKHQKMRMIGTTLQLRRHAFRQRSKQQLMRKVHNKTKRKPRFKSQKRWTRI